MICANKENQPALPAQPDSREAHRRRRRVELLKKAGLFRGLGSDLRVLRATSLKELLEAYLLVFQCYVEEGYILPDPSGLRLRVFEALPEMATFVAKIGDEVVAVMSLVPDSPDLGLPSDQCFGPELQALRAQGQRLCEVTNLAIRHEYRNSRVLLDLMQPAFAQALHYGCDDIFIAVCPSHGRVFEDSMLFEPWGGRRSYSKDHEDIVEGKRLYLVDIEARAVKVDEMLGDQAFLHDTFFLSNPFMGKLEETAQNARQRFLDPILLEELFLRRSDLLLRCNVAERNAIRRRWQDSLFNLVYGRQSQAFQADQAGQLIPWAEAAAQPKARLAG